MNRCFSCVWFSFLSRLVAKTLAGKSDPEMTSTGHFLSSGTSTQPLNQPWVVLQRARCSLAHGRLQIVRCHISSVCTQSHMTACQTHLASVLFFYVAAMSAIDTVSCVPAQSLLSTIALIILWISACHVELWPSNLTFPRSSWPFRPVHCCSKYITPLGWTEVRWAKKAPSGGTGCVCVS